MFIDGENLVTSYEDMKKRGRISNEGDVAYERKTFIWKNGTVRPGLNVINRATYYTYVQGDALKVSEIEDRIKEMFFPNYRPTGYHQPIELPSRLTPCVFKKSEGRASKGVDIQIALDILSHTYRNNLDTVFLMSGDGDYLPILKEVQQMGKQVFVAAFSRGLSPKLRRIADRFELLDDVYFEPVADDAEI